MSSLHDTFQQEACELIEELEVTTLQLEQGGSDPNLIQQLFRIMHTLKGTSGMFGFDCVQEYTHILETIYDEIREGRQRLDDRLIELTLVSVDHLKMLLASPQLSGELQTLHRARMADIQAWSQPDSGVLSNAEGQSGEHVYYISGKPQPDFFRNGTNLLYLIDDVAQLGVAEVRFSLAGVPEMASFDPIQCYVAFECVLLTTASESEVRAVFLFVEDCMELAVQAIPGGNLESVRHAARVFDTATVADPVLGIDAIVERTEARTASGSVQRGDRPGAPATMRISIEKVSELMNLVSEMVTTQARLTMMASQLDNRELTSISENAEKITRRLRDRAFEISLVPIQVILNRFERLVRDVSKDLGKEIEFKTSGGDTELDKLVIDKLVDPLLHLLRNCIDHGIEKPEDRVVAGKARKGLIHLNAFYEGTHVVIELTDDGAGIDQHRVLQKAKARGLVAEGAELSSREIHELIFMPGFSTAQQVTELSGRGVGLDVVRRNVSDLRGEVEVASTAGQGTKFRIRLPLTLSIIDGLLVGIGGTVYAIPIAQVEKCFEIRVAKPQETFEFLALEGERVPVYYLRKFYQVPSPPPLIQQVIKVRGAGVSLGIVVDSILGEYQVVLKPLGTLYHDSEEFSGATILGDGSVALVFEMPKLIKKLIDIKSNYYIDGNNISRQAIVSHV